MMLHSRGRNTLDRRLSRNQSAQQRALGVLPDLVYRDKYGQFVDKPAVKGLWREPGTPRDSIAVRTVKSAFVEFRCRRLNQPRSRINALRGSFGPDVGFWRPDFQLIP